MMPLVFPDWRAKVVFSSDGPQPQILAETDKFKVILGGLEAGQNIPFHPEGLATYYFLEGTGWMTVEAERFAVQPGVIVVTPAGAQRGVEADTRLAFLAARVA
jgi:quercetin dioxygenase-like cupin family protein